MLCQPGVRLIELLAGIGFWLKTVLFRTRYPSTRIDIESSKDLAKVTALPLLLPPKKNCPVYTHVLLLAQFSPKSDAALALAGCASPPSTVPTANTLFWLAPTKLNAPAMRLADRPDPPPRFSERLEL